MKKNIVCVLVACVFTASVFGIKFESGDSAFEIKGYLSAEISYLSQPYASGMQKFYAGLGYSSLIFDLWQGSKFHMRYSMAVRSQFPNVFGTSNNIWIPGMEAYGEFIPNDFLSIKAGQVLTPIGYLMQIHLMPALYPQVGPSAFFEEEILPYNTTIDIKMTFKLPGNATLPVNIFGGKPIANYGARVAQPAQGEIEINNLNLFGARVAYELGEYFKAGMSYVISEDFSVRLQVPYIVFENDYLLIVAEGCNKIFVASSGYNQSERSTDVLIGVHLGRFTPYADAEYMEAPLIGKIVRRYSAGVDFAVYDNLRLKAQFDYRDVNNGSYRAKPLVLRTSAVFNF
ncbi:MAG: hypothetical protein HZC28_16685 [Spirochaetes bacterium]|nr:hypothetical protein [Spirochaetota bacterium]